MKYFISYLIFYFVLHQVGCKFTTEKGNDVELKDTLICKKTHVIQNIKKSESYINNEDLYKIRFSNAYNAIKQLNFKSDFFKKLETGDYEKGTNPIPVDYFIIGMFYEDKTIYEAVVLFYLKYYSAYLEGEKYCYRILSNMGENSYTPIFYVIFVKISGHNPEKGMLVNTVYNWVQSQPNFLKNSDIKTEVEKIKLKENKIEK